MQLNVEQGTVAASDENRKQVTVEGDRVEYGMLDTEDNFVKEGSLDHRESVVLAHARVFRPTGISRLIIQDTDDDPDVTAEDADELLADAATEPKETSLASSSRSELTGDDLEAAGREADHPRFDGKAWSDLSADEKRKALAEKD